MFVIVSFRNIIFRNIVCIGHCLYSCSESDRMTSTCGKQIDCLIHIIFPVISFCVNLCNAFIFYFCHFIVFFNVHMTCATWNFIFSCLFVHHLWFKKWTKINWSDGWHCKFFFALEMNTVIYDHIYFLQLEKLCAQSELKCLCFSFLNVHWRKNLQDLGIWLFQFKSVELLLLMPYFALINCRIISTCYFSIFVSL